MTSVLRPFPPPAQAVPRSGASGLALAVFVAALALGAGLLFMLQPMFAKMILPMLGGTPAVWNTAMVVFQATLLAGYVYAHWLARSPSVRRQAAIHLAVLAAAAASLPIAVASGWTPPTQESPILWLMALMVVSVGPPFFAVSATAPLLQKWFALSGHRHAHDPYFLYAASNLGSLAGLLGYPLIVEGWLTLAQQSWLWSSGYLVLAGIIAGAGVMIARQPFPAPAAPGLVAADGDLPWRLKVHWLALAAVPSSLLLGVTAHISTDVAAVPLIWVLPLSLYLLTFVNVFARKPMLSHGATVIVQQYFVTFVLLAFWANKALWVELPLQLLAFFACAMVCHGELAKRRPATRHLTEFYLWLSLGGVLGGVFNALLAPLLFHAVYEYPLALIAACMLRPIRAAAANAVWSRRLDAILPLALLGIAIALNLAFGAYAQDLGPVGMAVYAIYAGLFLFSFVDRPVRFGLGVAALLVAPLFADASVKVLERDRSFFGVYKIMRTADGAMNWLMHGTTLHGAQFVDPARWREPLVYFSPEGPLGQALLGLAQVRPPATVGVIGLGIGTMTCYRQPGQQWTYFEIDPVVARLARDERYFRFLAACGADTPVVLGDARLSLRSAASRNFDVLILDAFSSDAIPLHLLTREAFALYLDKLADAGMLLLHISNRHLDLEPVVAEVAAASGLVASIQHHLPEGAAGGARAASSWVVVARAAGDIAFLTGDRRWRPLRRVPGRRPWSDDHSSILDALLR